MKKQIPALIMTVCCIGLLTALLQSNKTIKTLRAELDEQSKKKIPAETVNTAPSEPVETVAAIPGITSAETAEKTVQPESRDEKEKEPTFADQQQRIMKTVADMRDNPTMNKVIEASQRGTMGALYGDFIEYLKLNPEETNYFMDLIMQRQMANVDFGMKLMGGEMSAEERQEMADKIHAVGEQVKKEMKNFLNSEKDFDEWRYYEKTMGERMALSQMDQKLANAGAEQLSDKEYRELLDMMYTERTEYDWTTDLHDDQKNDISPERWSKDNMQKHSADVEQLGKNILERAKAMLTPEQYESFKESLLANAALQMAQFEMAGQLLRGDQ